jgi:hypothetical protein
LQTKKGQCANFQYFYPGKAQKVIYTQAAMLLLLHKTTKEKNKKLSSITLKEKHLSKLKFASAVKQHRDNCTTRKLIYISIKFALCWVYCDTDG